MSNDNKLDHEYDGIRESDNDLPNWWLNIFYVSIVFAIGYMIYYHWGGKGEGQVEVYNKVMQAASAQQNGNASQGFTDEEVVNAAKQPNTLAEGKALFASKCVACHAVDGGGGIGPNLTDDYWIHGGKPSQISHTITEGVLDKGMVAWKTVLSKNEILAVSAYVTTLHGTKPAVPKAPQGNKE